MASLNDKYELENGQAYMSGLQALVRLPIIQSRIDKSRGLNTSGFISGYRGSPLGGYDSQLQKASEYLKEANIHFEPGINEDLAATAVWGSQQIHFGSGSDLDGVFGIWYGKGPGVDRSLDALRHANLAGTSSYGGVLALGGDDHGARSSTTSHQSDHNWVSAFIPYLYPAGVSELVEFGLLGIAMSRYTGAWTGMKILADVADASVTADLSKEKRKIIIPDDFEMPEGGLHIRFPDNVREQDVRLQRYKGFAAQAFARANNIDQIIWKSDNAKIGIMASGKSYEDVREALHFLGVDEEVALDIGLCLYKVGMPWPLEPLGVRKFSQGLEEILVVEEKRELIEHQLKWQLFNWKENERPIVVGKNDEENRWLLPAENELPLQTIIDVVAQRLAKKTKVKDIQKKLLWFRNRENESNNRTPLTTRSAYFCSGCPHNTSTKLPEGSYATAGIGCHYLALNMDRETQTYSHMGGEGVSWIGRHRFARDKHMFVNIGDGTYQHSGLLAIKAAVASGMNATYKILYNDAVAMTGGQKIEGNPSVIEIAFQVQAEGVRDISIVAEDPKIYEDLSLPEGVKVFERGLLDNIQRKYRDIPGCTVIIYDQTCAAEKRRRRKRGLMPDPLKRVYINPNICEGCGDCSTQSNCISIEPLETELGRKRKINQSNCNKDFSCVEGFCPSFITFEVKEGKKKENFIDPPNINISDPEINELKESWNILVTGVGGTGVVTIGALIGMAANIEGKKATALDMTGLAQKNGAVWSHIRIDRKNEYLRSNRIPPGSANLLLACDPIVSIGEDSLSVISKETTSVVINYEQHPVSDFIFDRDFEFNEKKVMDRIIENTKGISSELPAGELAEKIIGNSIGSNLLLLGAAWQRGLVPLEKQSIYEAINLNAVSVKENIAIFEWGRCFVEKPELINEILGRQQTKEIKIDDFVNARCLDLISYQNKSLSKEYRKIIEDLRDVVKSNSDEDISLVKATIKNLYKVMAYKDEYEVARLHIKNNPKKEVQELYPSTKNVYYHLSPPFAPKDSSTGRPKKYAIPSNFIRPLFFLLSHLRKLRGTVFDFLGYREERRNERELIRMYQSDIELVKENYEFSEKCILQQLLDLPEIVRGFGPIKHESFRKYKKLRKKLRHKIIEI